MKIISNVIILIVIIYEGNTFANFGWSCGIGYNNNIFGFGALEIRHSADFTNRFKYDIKQYALTLFINDKINNKLNIPLDIFGGIDFAYQFTEGPMNDFLGIPLAAISGRWLFPINDNFKWFIANTICPVYNFDDFWWIQENLGLGVEIRSDVKQDKITYNNAKDHFTKPSKNYLYRNIIRITFNYNVDIEKTNRSFIGILLSFSRFGVDCLSFADKNDVKDEL